MADRLPNRRAKLFHIITRLDMGGSAQNTLDTCLLLDQSTYDVYLAYGLSLESKMTDAEKKQVENKLHLGRGLGVNIIPLPELVRRIDPINDLKTFYSLFGLIKRTKPDIVHTHSSKAGVLGRLAAKLAGVPHIVHTPHGHVFYGHFHPIAARIYQWIEKLLALITDRMVALTAGEKNDYINLSVCHPDKLLQIHSGVNLKLFSNLNADIPKKRQSLGIGGTGPVIGFVGWLLPIKGPMHLLRSMKIVWRHHPNTSLVFVGKGDLDHALKAEALKMNANDRVVFLGWRPDIQEIMSIFDIFVLPSLNEGMGRVLIEAMAAGKPVVASEVGGIPDLVRHNETGFLVPPADEMNLSEAILRLLQNPDEARTMGECGKAQCLQYSTEAMVDKIEELYAMLLNRKGLSNQAARI